MAESIRLDLIRGFDLSGWHLRNATYIFPDWFLWFTIRFFVNDISFSFFLYSLCLHLGVFFWIKSQFEADPSRNIKISVAILLWAFLFPNEWWVFSAPIQHGGSLVIGLWWTNYYLKFEKIGRAEFVVLVLVASIASASDLFFGLWFLLPIAITTLIYQKEIGRRSLLGLAIIVSTIISYNLLRWLTGISLDNTLDIFQFNNFVFNLSLLYQYLLICQFKLIILVLGFILFLRKPTPASVCYFLSSVVTLTFIMSTGYWKDQDSVRYFLPMSFFIVISLTRHLFLLRRKIIKFTFAIMCIVLGLVSMGTKLKSFQTGISVDIESVKCIDRHLFDLNLIDRPGLATYWAYKMNLALSEHRLSMAQIHKSWFSYNLVTNDLWKPDAFAYHYLITTPGEKMAPNVVNEISSELTCGRYILILPKKLFFLYNM